MNKFVYACLVGAISATKYETKVAGNTFEITYDDADKVYNFNVDVTVGNDLWLAYGDKCDTTTCDMVQFLTTGAGSIKDAYGTTASPRNDFINDYKNTKIVKSSDASSMNFQATRAPAPTDVIGKDVKFECGTEQTFTYINKPDGETDTWKFKLNDDCTVYQEPAPEPTPEPTTPEDPAGATYIAVASAAATTAMLVSLF